MPFPDHVTFLCLISVNPCKILQVFDDVCNPTVFFSLASNSVGILDSDRNKKARDEDVNNLHLWSLPFEPGTVKTLYGLRFRSYLSTVH